jgi:hypothetical protein
MDYSIKETELWSIEQNTDQIEGRGRVYYVYATNEAAAASFAQKAGVMGTQAKYEKVPNSFTVFRNGKVLGFIPGVNILNPNQLITMTEEQESKLVKGILDKLTDAEKKVLPKLLAKI